MAACDFRPPEAAAGARAAGSPPNDGGKKPLFEPFRWDGEFAADARRAGAAGHARAIAFAGTARDVAAGVALLVEAIEQCEISAEPWIGPARPLFGRGDMRALMRLAVASSRLLATHAGDELDELAEEVHQISGSRGAAPAQDDSAGAALAPDEPAPAIAAGPTCEQVVERLRSFGAELSRSTNPGSSDQADPLDAIGAAPAPAAAAPSHDERFKAAQDLAFSAACNLDAATSLLSEAVGNGTAGDAMVIGARALVDQAGAALALVGGLAGGFHEQPSDWVLSPVARSAARVLASASEVPS